MKSELEKLLVAGYSRGNHGDEEMSDMEAGRRLSVNSVLKFQDWTFVVHQIGDGEVYGCLWKGIKPKRWNLENLVKMSESDVNKFKVII